MAKRRRCPYDFCFKKDGTLIPLTCGQWGCKRCARDLAQQWAKRVNLHLQTHDGQQWYMVTFTFRGTQRSVPDAYRRLPSIWDRIRKAWRAFTGGDKWEYCAFLEGQPQRQGMPHLHIISNLKTPTRDHDFAMSHGFGYQAKTRPVDGPRGAYYVSKYASKTDNRIPKGARRIRTSGGWSKLPDKARGEYIMRGKKESVGEYLVRVANATGRQLQAVADDYAEALALRAHDERTREVGVTG